jgi:choline dehydrogenase
VPVTKDGRTASFDVIVVGSGAGGAVVARRVADTGASVLLLEAGGPDLNPAIHDPVRVHELWHSEDDWAYSTEPQPGLGGRTVHWPRGRVMGGSTAFHGMMWFRGWRGDYDHWAYLGNEGWRYEDVLPLFRRTESFDGGASEYHGADGPIPARSKYEHHPVSTAVVAAAGEYGIPYNPDFNGPVLEGAGFAQFTIRDGRRVSAATAYLTPLAGDPRLTVWTQTPARRLVMEGTRCAGVEILHDGAVEIVRAGHEVVVCAGAIESPKLLMLSGIGAAEQLAEHGIDVVVDLPGVGENLHDHILAPLIFSSKQALPPAREGYTFHQGNIFWHSREGLPGPDLQPLIFHVPLYEDWMPGPDDAFTIMAGLVRPASRGTVRLASPDPEAPPLLDPGYLTCESDLHALTASLGQIREICAQPALAEWVAEELYPGPGVSTEAEIHDYLRRSATTYHHQAGSCKMGIDALAVVDPELRVHGTTGLRIADASIMPAVTSGNTAAPTSMIGERCADLVTASLGR